MSPDHNHRDDETTTTPAGDEATGDAPAVRPAGSDGPEDGAFDKPSGGAPAPRSVHPEPPPADTAQTAEIRPEGEPPLITAVEIENFKGIGRPVRIELRPITLLFGRNSAGKSTVLHALCYAHEILSHRNVDAHKTDLGGDQIDLGGFRRFVHGHDLKRSVRLRFELNLAGLVLPEPGGGYEAMPLGWSRGAFADVASLEEAETGWLELRVTWKTERDEPIVSDYEVGVDGQVLGHIQAPASGRMATLLANLSHPLLGYDIDRDEKVALSRYVGQVREDPDTGGYAHGLRPLQVLLEPEKALRPTSSAVPCFDQHFWIQDKTLDDRSRFDIPRLLAGIGLLLRDQLAMFRYLGPLRDLHPCAMVERERFVPGRWADGSAAWDVLNRRAQVTSSRIANDFGNPRERNRAMVVRRVSDWLSRQDRLDTGYRLRVDRTLHLGANAPLVGVLNKSVEGEKWGAPFLAKLAGMSGAETADDLVRGAPDEVAALLDRIAKAPVHGGIQLVSTRANMPVRTSDIGVGISQLLPVVVAVLDPDHPGITAIEQPELHVHPRLQVELGDLFAEGAARGNVFLIETHSEHLLLRIMRRMRETNLGTLPAGVPEIRPEDVNVLFVEPDGAETLIREMPLNEKGELVKAWPGGFFEEDLGEIF